MTNRRFEFRIWDKMEKRMNYAGDPFWHHFAIGLRGNVYHLQNGSGGDEYILQQFTGEFDNNGDMIFEGDIVQFKKTTYRSDEETSILIEPVGYHLNGFSPSQSDSETCEDSFYDIRYHDFVVIGNIFENPDLIK